MTTVAIDTNILLRLAEPGHVQHLSVLTTVERLRLAGHRLVLLPQIIYEFWAVATRTAAANGLGMSTVDADQLIDQLTKRILVMRDERGVYERWRELARQYKVTGTNSHDTRIVAAMIRHDISRLLTSNPSDFVKYREIEVLTPDSATVSH